MGFVLLGGEKMRSFFPLVHVAVPEKKRIKCICLIRREKLPLFFHWPAASSTGVHRVKRKKDTFVL